jgi:putative inorganic carbon (HCO3(-)) transporter
MSSPRASLAALPEKLTLTSLDQGYQSALENSFVLSPFVQMGKGLHSKLASSSGKIGNILQKGSMLCLLLLFVCLGLPQFASDKEGLALVALVSLALYASGRLLGGDQGRKMRASDGLVLGYLAANVVATFASHYLPESIKGLSKVAVYILSYFLFTATLQNDAPGRKRLTAILVTAIAIGLVVSVYGLYQWKIGVAPLATWEDPTVESKGTRVFSTLGNPNLLAGYLIPFVPLSIVLGLAAFYNRHKYAIQGKTLCLIAGLGGLGTALVIGLATVLTGSRAGYLALGAMTACMVLAFLANMLGKKPKLVLPTFIGIVLLGVGAALAIHFFAPSLEQRLTSIFAGSNHSSNAYRMYVWNASLRMFEDNWWFGVGPGNTAFRLAYGLYMTSGFDALGTYCVPLEVGVECGVLGIFFFAALIINALACAHVQFWRANQSVYERLLALGLATALIGLSVQGMVDTVFYRPQVQFLFWLLIAALIELKEDRVK